MSHPNVFRWLSWLILVAVLPGCDGGDGGPGRFPLQGSVTFDDKPVPQGQITFSPDSSQGNTGPGSLAIIKDGTYATSPGRGILGGAYVIEVAGSKPGEGVDEDGEAVVVTLFSSYSMQAELPAGGGTFDIDVPAEAATGARR